MTSRDDNPDPVDLLYDDELDEETEAELRAEVEESSEARDELERNEAFLERVRASHEPAEVPSDVHESIVQEARDAVDGDDTESNGSDGDVGGANVGDEREDDTADSQPEAPSSDPSAPDDTPARTAPDHRSPRSDAGSEERSFWERRGNASTFRKYANAAILLLLSGGLLFALMQTFGTTVSQKFDKANQAVSSQVTFGGGGGEATAEAAGETDEEPTGGPAAPATDDEPETREKLALEESRESESKTREIQGAPETDRDRRERAAPDDQNEQKQVEEREKEKKRLAQKELARRESSDDESTDNAAIGEMGDSVDTPSGASPESESAPAESEDESSGLAAFAESSGSPSKTGSGSSVGADDGTGSAGEKTAKLEGSAEPSAPSSAGDDSSTGGSAGVAERETESEGAEKTSDQADEPDSLEDAIDAGDWTRAQSLADTRIGNDEFSDTDRARAYELKARALAEQGKTKAALETLEALSEAYPNYKPDEIESKKDDYRPESDRPAGESSGSPDSSKIMLEKE